jgi:hypothetical protein
MKRYANLSGNSGVTSYETGTDWIDVKFRNGDIYRYTHAKPGEWHVRMMKRLAVSGRGLSTYIARNVQSAYASKR